MLVILLLCFLTGLMFLYNYVQKRSYSWKKIVEFPGDNPLPLLGNSLQLGFHTDEITNKLLALWTKHGKQNFRCTVGSEHWLLLSNPDDIGTVLNLTTELSKPLERNAAMRPLFGNSLSSLDDEKWRSTRKLMTSSFHFTTLEKRVEDVNKSCNRLFAILDTHDGKGPIDLYRYVKPFLYDLLSSTLMGVETNLLADPDHPYLQTGEKVVDVVTRIFYSHWRHIRPLFFLTPTYWKIQQITKTMRSRSAHVINERKTKLSHLRNEALKDDKNVESLIEKELCDNGCLLDKLLHNGECTPDKISDEVTQISFTGHYTTTLPISHTLYYLAKYPEIQRKVLEEQEAIISNNPSSKLTNQELNQMYYLEAVIKETIRVIPPVTKIGRRLKKDLTFKDGRVAPAGSTLIVLYEALYQNPEVFPEPEIYRPERFLQSMHTFALIPFGAGPRNCIGYRYAWVIMKTTLSNILRRYEVLPGGPGLEPQFRHRITTDSKNGIHLRFKKRK